MKSLYTILIIALVSLSTIVSSEPVNSSSLPEETENKNLWGVVQQQNLELVQRIYAAYDVKNKALGKMPDSKKVCIENLSLRKEIITAMLAELSYKNVLLSPRYLLNFSALVMGPSAAVTGHIVESQRFNNFKKAIPSGITNYLNSDQGRAEIEELHNRYMVQEKPESFIAYQLATAHARGNLDTYFEEGFKNSGLFSGGFYSPTIRYAVGGLAVLSTIVGFGLYKDIQAMNAKKTELNAELETIKQILLLLEKKQNLIDIDMGLELTKSD